MINKETYSDQIYEALKQDIICHRIGLGEKLINRELQQRFGVSSTPVRDAINRLYLDGFVEEITKAGARVIDFDCNIAMENNEIISMLSDNAIKMSAAKSDIAEISKILSQQLTLQRQNLDNDDYYKYDNEFHLTFFRFSHNQRFSDLYERYNILQEILIRYVYVTNSTQKDIAINQHEQIYLAYKKGDITAARKHMENHYILVGTLIQKGFPMNIKS